MSARDGHRRRVRHTCMPRGVTPASRARTSEICRHASSVLDGIDLGGTKIYAAVLDAAGRVVWDRRIVMPVAEIRGTHLCNAYEVTRMNDMIAAGILDVTEPTVVPWEGLPEAHQSMWDNRHTGATYIVNHALPGQGLRGKDELYEAWAALKGQGE